MTEKPLAINRFNSRLGSNIFQIEEAWPKCQKNHVLHSFIATQAPIKTVDVSIENLHETVFNHCSANSPPLDNFYSYAPLLCPQAAPKTSEFVANNLNKKLQITDEPIQRASSLLYIHTSHLF